MDEIEVTHITHLADVSFAPPDRVILGCVRKDGGPTHHVLIEHDNLGAFIMSVMRAAAIAQQQLGEPRSPAMIPLSDVEVSAAPSMQTVAIALHMQGCRIPLALSADTARRAAESLLRHAAMIDPPESMN